MDYSNKIYRTLSNSKNSLSNATISFLPSKPFLKFLILLYIFFNADQFKGFIQQLKLSKEKSNQVMNQFDHSDISEKAQPVSEYESSASQSSKAKIYKRKKITKVIHTCCISYKNQKGQPQTAFYQKNMNFNFATVETIRKLAMTKSTKHDKTILEKFKVENSGKKDVRQAKTEVNEIQEQFFPFFNPNFCLNRLLMSQQVQF